MTLRTHDCQSDHWTTVNQWIRLLQTKSLDLSHKCFNRRHNLSDYMYLMADFVRNSLASQCVCCVWVLHIKWLSPLSQVFASSLWSLTVWKKKDLVTWCNIMIGRYTWGSYSLVPRPPPFLFFGFRNTRKCKSVKNGEGLGIPITWMTSGGHKVDVGGEGSTFK